MRRFEEVVLPYLDSAYNLARWVLRNEQDAKDAVQESVLRALKFFSSFHGSDGRVWLLAIVRNTCYTWLRNRKTEAASTSFDEEIHGFERENVNQEELLLQVVNSELVREALEELPLEYREVIIFRELEGLSYKEIAELVQIPMGTVMSRLARARKLLHQRLSTRKGVLS